MNLFSTLHAAKRIFFISGFTLFVSISCFAQNIFDSVVQIEVAGKKRGIGVVAGQKDHVVTALHVVAGMQNIRVYSKVKGRSVAATIVRVNKESDLALLTLNEPLGLPAVQISDETPNARNKYFIYGYTNTPEVRESIMALSTNFFPLTSIIEPTTPQYKWLTDNGFPKPSAQIIRLDDPIQHGDSGSPILNEQGQLVGIADGGLQKGVRRMNWGISTKAHFAALWNSNENVKVSPSTLPFLKNARSENTKFQNTPEALDLYYIFSDYLSNITETTFDVERNMVLRYREDAYGLSQRDILSQVIHVYEDYNTGATLAVPEGLEFEYNSRTGLLRTWSPSGNVEMNILIKNNSSFGEAFKRVDNFQDELFMHEKWYDRTTGNGYTYDPDNELYEESINCTQYDDHQNERSSLIAEILIDGSYVMATSVTVYDTSLAYKNPIDWYYTYLMEACLVLSGFAIN